MTKLVQLLVFYLKPI